MRTIIQEYRIAAPIDQVWQALVDPAIIEEWGGGPAVMNDRLGTEFKLWGGDIYGRNTEVVAPILLEQEWSDSKLEAPTQVRFEISERDDVTTVRLVHSNVPDAREADLAKGWEDYYLGPLKDFVEHKQ